MKQQVKHIYGQFLDIFCHWLKIIRLIIVRFVQEGFTYRVSALTYTSLLAIVPMLTVLVAFLSLFHVFHSLGPHIQHYIFKNFVPATGQTLETYFDSFTQQASKLPPIGLVALVIISIMLMFTIERTFNDVWYVKVRRRGVIKFLLYWAIITIGPICIGLSFFVSSYIFSIGFVAKSSTLLGIRKVFLDISPFLLTAVGLTVLNIIVPNCKVKVRFGLLGGVVSALFFELAKRGFAWYAVSMSGYQLIYGAIAIIPLFLLWLYISWFIVLAGAILAHTAATAEKSYQGPSLPPFLHAFLLLRILWLAQQKGEELSLRELMKQCEGKFQVPTDIVMQELAKAGLVKRTEYSGYVLAFDCERLLLYDMLERLPWPVPRTDALKEVQQKTLTPIKQHLLNYDKHLQSEFGIALSQLF